jgi:hypothetical protein
MVGRYNFFSRLLFFHRFLLTVNCRSLFVIITIFFIRVFCLRSIGSPKNVIVYRQLNYDYVGKYYQNVNSFNYITNYSKFI